MKRFSFILLVLAAVWLAIMPLPVWASARFSALSASMDLAAGGVTVTGEVDSGKEKISIEIMSTGGKVLSSGKTSSESGGSFTKTCSLKGARSGDYIVKASMDDGNESALAFFSLNETAVAERDKIEAVSQPSIKVVVPLLSPPTVAINAPTDNAKGLPGEAVIVSASGTCCDHMVASYKDAQGKVTWLGVQSGNSYNTSFKPQQRGTCTVTVQAANTPNDAYPGSLGVSTSNIMVVETPTPTVRLIVPSDIYDGTICPPGAITISAVGTGCDNMEACIIKNNQQTSLGIQRGNSYQATITETERADILVIIYGRNTAASTDPGYKQVQKSAYLHVRTR